MSASAGPQWSLRHELGRVLVLTALLPALLFGIALLWNQWQTDRDALLLRQDANARLTANAIDDFLEGQRAGIEVLVEQETQDDGREADLGRLLRVYPAMLRALRVDADGHILAARDARGRPVLRDGAGMAGYDWFAHVRDNRRAFISDAYRTPFEGNDVVVAVAAPIIDPDGRFRGALEAAIPVQSIARLNADSLYRRNLELLLLDRRNRVVFAGPGLRWDLLADTGAVGAAIREDALPASRQSKVRVRTDVLHAGGDAFVDAVIMRNGWVVALVAPKQNLVKPFLPRLGMLLGLVLVTLVGVALALWRQKRLLRASIGYALASLRGYALGGRLDPVLMARMPEELQPLADGIAELGARMNTAYDELRHALDERERVIAQRTASLQDAVSELDMLSRTDALTGSLNYRGFLEAGERLWGQATASGRPLSVLALDIDHFKRYNDLYGHAEGDGALRRFAGAVRSALQHADDVLARPGGEEFTVFLPGSTAEQAMQVAERICRRVRDADIVHAASPKGRMTVSIGVATRLPGDDEAEDMLKRADDALYRAKAGGRDQAQA